MKNTLIILLIGLFFYPFSLVNAADYYWVGNTGDWGDISHWATTSGGNISHNQAPTANDNVIFDTNSFSLDNQVVTVNSDIAFCNNMDWGNVAFNPIFRAPEVVVLNIYGSINLIDNMDWQFRGDLQFKSTMIDNTINFTRHVAGKNVLFEGSGRWELNSPLIINSTFQFNQGTLLSNDQDISCQYFYVLTNGQKILSLANSNITISGNYQDDPIGLNDVFVAIFEVSNLDIIAGSSHVEYTGSEIEILYQGNGNIAFYDVVLSNPNGISRIIPDAGVNISRYHQLDLNHFTRINGQNTADELLLHPGKQYIFESGFRQTFENIIAIGSCTETINITSSNSGDATIFVSNSPGILLDFVTLRDVHAEGNTNFMVNNGIDLGNNNGWTIMPKTEENLFWVGGTGDWSNPMHWSFISGGAGGACVPTAVDNVFFDENSFSTGSQNVNINTENAYCKNMDWTGATNNPSLVGLLSNSIRINGSLIFIPNMELSFEGDFYFESTQQVNTITSAEQSFQHNVYFDGAGGEWTLLDKTNIGYSLYLKNGTFRTNNQEVRLANFFSNYNTNRGLFLGNSHLFIIPAFAECPEWRLQSDNLTFDAGTSTIETLNGSCSILITTGNEPAAYHNIIFNNSLPALVNGTSEDDEVSANYVLFKLSGSIQNIYIKRLELTAGYRYVFSADRINIIDELVAAGNCEGLVYLTSKAAGTAAKLSIRNDHVLEKLFLTDIDQTGNGNLTANNSFDGGNVSGWTINKLTTRQLYWIGNGGNWYDTNHWSLTSGGAGGECPPTPVDDIFFDENSANISNIDVYSTRIDVFFHDMIWGDVQGTPNLRLGQVQVYGSLEFQQGMTTSGMLNLQSNDLGETILSNGVDLRNIVFQGKGEWSLLDPLFITGRMTHLNGIFRTNDFSLTASIYTFFSQGGAKIIDLGSSHVRLTGGQAGTLATWYVQDDEVTIIPGNSLIEFLHPNATMENRGNVRYHNVLFSNPTGEVRLETFNNAKYDKLTFFGDASIFGPNSMDSLIFSAGKTYVLEANETQEVQSYLQIIGNNCTPIELNSSQTGIRSTLFMSENGQIIADFVQMRDQNGRGGADFKAGAHSTNISSTNIGWTFEELAAFTNVGFLGEDQILCNTNSRTLNAYNFSPSETYRWQDGSTDSIFTINQAGTYFVEVTFLNNCVIEDTIQLFAADELKVNLPADTSLCESESLLLDATTTVNNATYTWQDGSQSTDFQVTTNGFYKVIVEKGGCTTSDSLNVIFIENPAIDLGMNRALCENETTILDATQVNATYEWQDGSTNPTFLVTESGNYSVLVLRGQCQIKDTVVIDYITTSFLNLGADTTLCEGNRLLLDITSPNAAYQWQDGSTDGQFLVENAGDYFVVLSLSNCFTTDTITVTFSNAPDVNFGKAIENCDGETFTLQAGAPADEYLWSTGSTTPNLTTDTAGVFWLEVSIGNCSNRDTQEVIFNPLPIFELGSDTSLCNGEVLNLNSNINFTNAQYEWQDSSVSSEFRAENSGLFILKLTQNNCSFKDSVLVDFRPVPIVDLGEQEVVFCEGDKIELESPITQNATLEWNTGATTESINTNQPGIYWLEAKLNNCSNRDSILVNTVAPPPINLGLDFTLCEGQTSILEVTQENAQYLWQDGSTNPVFLVEKSGLIWAKISIGNCTANDTVLIGNTPSPVVDLGMDHTLCRNDSLELEISDNQSIIIWSDGDVNNLKTINKEGLYWVELDLNGCTARDSINILIQALPQIDLGEDIRFCDNEIAEINPIISEGILQWFDGSRDNNFSPSISGLVWAEVNNNGCTNRDSINVLIDECNFFKAYIPNAFSPDRNGINDVFKPEFDPDIEITSYKFHIFDRWGNQVFITQQIDIGWDGIYQDKIVDQAVFLYFIEIEFMDDNGVGHKLLSGDIGVIR